MNDVSTIYTAFNGISTHKAVGAAREAADFVLLQRTCLYCPVEYTKAAPDEQVRQVVSDIGAAFVSCQRMAPCTCFYYGFFMAVESRHTSRNGYWRIILCYAIIPNILILIFFKYRAKHMKGVNWPYKGIA
ncbi:hypothetical protein A9970_01840 [Sphingobacterium sp. UME9]|nr:hypothetical protein [Sphingobacterium sp. UME9]OFV09555.1 hypothetical protein HMPREF3127_23095 [Sphingobacterium sp. HMSC13C05]HAL53826.1 hypothetical protein [Sphingobacterium sp.]